MANQTSSSTASSTSNTASSTAQSQNMQSTSASSSTTANVAGTSTQQSQASNSNNSGPGGGGGGGGGGGASNVSSQQANATSNSNAQLQNSSLFEMVLCRLQSHTPQCHILNEPRILDCGHSACLGCILAAKDADKNLKCPYCNGVHKIPADPNKLLVNKNLQTFIKYNIRTTMNQLTIKQNDESLMSYEEKLQQNSNFETLDQYLALVENDLQAKIENMKTTLEKFGEQFVHYIRTTRREIQKKIVTTVKEDQKTNLYRQIFETSNQSIKDNFSLRFDTNDGLINQYHVMYPFGSDNKQPQQQQQQTQQQITQLQHHPQHLQQQQQLQQPQNHHHLNTTHHTQQQQQQHQRNNTTNTHLTNSTYNTTILNTSNQTLTSNLNTNTSNANVKTTSSLDSNLNNLNATLNGSQANSFPTFSNSSSYNEDLDDLEAELNAKPVNLHSTKRHINKEQVQFNKFVREEVTKRFGETFLLQHEVNQLDSSIMELIKNEAISSFLPKDTAPARAWTLAKVSLRSLKRDLRRKHNQLFKKQECQKMISHHPYYDNGLN